MRALGILLAVAVAGHAAAQTQAQAPRLGGTVVSGKDRVAIFVGSSGTTAVVEGEPIGPFTVRRIARGSVELQGPQGIVVAVPSHVAEPVAPPNGWPVAQIPASDK